VKRTLAVDTVEGCRQTSGRMNRRGPFLTLAVSVVVGRAAFAGSPDAGPDALTVVSRSTCPEKGLGTSAAVSEAPDQARAGPPRLPPSSEAWVAARDRWEAWSLEALQSCLGKKKPTAPSAQIVVHFLLDRANAVEVSSAHRLPAPLLACLKETACTFEPLQQEALSNPVGLTVSFRDWTVAIDSESDPQTARMIDPKVVRPCFQRDALRVLEHPVGANLVLSHGAGDLQVDVLANSQVSPFARECLQQRLRASLRAPRSDAGLGGALVRIRVVAVEP
jgi:hypothetical protein